MVFQSILNFADLGYASVFKMEPVSKSDTFHSCYEINYMSIMFNRDVFFKISKKYTIYRFSHPNCDPSESVMCCLIQSSQFLNLTTLCIHNIKSKNFTF